FRRGMKDVRAVFDCSPTRSSKRNLLQINAKGDAYMDLLYIEAKDDHGQSFCTFIPLQQEWKTYVLSLDDLIPMHLGKGKTSYRSIKPEEIKTIAIGTNRKTIWPEKPMTFSVGQVSLAENYYKNQGPTPALNRLTVPFKEIGLSPPLHVFAPFYASK